MSRKHDRKSWNDWGNRHRDKDHDGDWGRGNDHRDRDDDVISINVSTSPAVSRNLGPGDDVVKVSSTTANDVRLTFTSAEVGNGNPRDSTTTSPQDGGLAVRLQAENAAGGLVGPVSRFDDEGITFKAQGGVQFDVRDLVTGAERGENFDVVQLGTQGADTVDERGSNETYYINAGMGNDRITGGNEDDFLVGGAGNDTLNGSFGFDRYIGGGGMDQFVFDTALGANNIDRILDFTAADDTIRLDTDVFTGLTAGTLGAGAFVSSAAGVAVDADDRIIYDTDSGQLFFDANGSGAGGAVQFAVLTPGNVLQPATGLTAADFVVFEDRDDRGGNKRHDAKNGRDDQKYGWDRDDHKNGWNRGDDRNGDDRNNDHKGHGNRHDAKNGRDDHKDGRGRDDNDLARADEKVLEKIFGKDPVEDADQFFASSFLALNDSKVSGAALLMFDEQSNELSVAVSAHGLTPNQVHIQHIHGFTGQNPMNASVPDNDQDDDKDGFVEIAEGSDTYGPVLLNFTPFPTADANGDIFFVNTYTLPSTPPADRPSEFLDIPPDLTLREIVLHGLTIPAGFGVGTPGEVNGAGGYIPALPVASNEIVDLNSADGNLAITEFRNEVKDWAFA